MRFATWNVWDYGLAAHAADQEHLVQEVIRQVAPDVLAVQEICGAHRGPAVLRRLAAAVGMECTAAPRADDEPGEVAIASGHPGSRYHVGIMWQADVFDAPPRIDRPAAGEFWHALVTLTGTIANRPVRFASFHGRPFGLHARADEFDRVVTETARNYGGQQPPTLVGADWNATSADVVGDAGVGVRFHQPDPFARAEEWDPAWLHQCRTSMDMATGGLSWAVDREAGARLRDGGLADVAALLGEPAHPTCGYAAGADMPARAIDQIRANAPMQPALAAHEVVTGPDVEAASDHRMVVAALDPGLLDPS